MAATTAGSARATLDVEVSTVGVGYQHACAITAAGALFCWGSNDGGENGLGTTGAQATPAQVGSATTWTQIMIGHNLLCNQCEQRTLLLGAQ